MGIHGLLDMNVYIIHQADGYEDYLPHHDPFCTNMFPCCMRQRLATNGYKSPHNFQKEESPMKGVREDEEVELTLLC